MKYTSRSAAEADLANIVGEVRSLARGAFLMGLCAHADRLTSIANAIEADVDTIRGVRKRKGLSCLTTTSTSASH